MTPGHGHRCFRTGGQGIQEQHPVTRRASSVYLITHNLFASKTLDDCKPLQIDTRQHGDKCE